MENIKNVQIKSIDSYVKDFIPTLSNFCAKCPLQPTVSYIKEINRVFIRYRDKNLEIYLDPTKNKKEVIKRIKNSLQKDYPVIYEKQVLPPDAKEVESLMSRGISLSEALNKNTVHYEPKYKIMRVHHKYNEIDCYDMKNHALYKFKAKFPVTSILEELYNSSYDNEDIMNNSMVLLYKIGK